jgi:hypothetical protein
MMFKCVWWLSGRVCQLLNGYVIRTVEGMPAQGRPAWWADGENHLRVQSVISDFAFDLHLGLNDAQREQFARLLVDAADALLRRAPPNAPRDRCFADPSLSSCHPARGHIA